MKNTFFVIITAIVAVIFSSCGSKNDNRVPSNRINIDRLLANRAQLNVEDFEFLKQGVLSKGKKIKLHWVYSIKDTAGVWVFSVCDSLLVSLGHHKGFEIQFISKDSTRSPQVYIQHGPRYGYCMTQSIGDSSLRVIIQRGLDRAVESLSGPAVVPVIP